MDQQGGGRRRAAGSCRVSMAEPGGPQQHRNPRHGLEQGSWLSQRGGTRSWPWEEGEDGTGILHRQMLAMPGGAVGQTHDILAQAELQRTPRSIPAKCERRHHWVCFSVHTISPLRGTEVTHLYTLLSASP